MEWILVILLLSPTNHVTRFELEYKTEDQCLDKNVELMLTWDDTVAPRKEYIESWCEYKNQREEINEIIT